MYSRARGFESHGGHQCKADARSEIRCSRGEVSRRGEVAKRGPLVAVLTADVSRAEFFLVFSKGLTDPRGSRLLE